MGKVRVIHEVPVMTDDGALKFARELAGPTAARATVDTSVLANGTLYMETDGDLNIIPFDEDSGWSEE